MCQIHRGKNYGNIYTQIYKQGLFLERGQIFNKHAIVLSRKVRVGIRGHEVGLNFKRRVKIHLIERKWNIPKRRNGMSRTPGYKRKNAQLSI